MGGGLEKRIEGIKIERFVLFFIITLPCTFLLQSKDFVLCAYRTYLASYVSGFGFEPVTTKLQFGPLTSSYCTTSLARRCSKAFLTYCTEYKDLFLLLLTVKISK